MEDNSWRTYRANRESEFVEYVAQDVLLQL